MCERGFAQGNKYEVITHIVYGNLAEKVLPKHE